MGIRDIVAPFTVWKRAFETPYTERKPIAHRPGAPRYRGFHTNASDICIGCGQCDKICQNAAIDMVEIPGKSDKKGRPIKRPRVDYGRCCWCALCIDICPTGSLSLTNEYIWVDSDGDAFVYVPGEDEMPWDENDSGWGHNGKRKK